MDNNSPLVSVIIPMYNESSFISETIHSLLAQTHSNTQIIVVDDGSEDHSRDIVSEIPDVELYVNATNMGQTFSRNRGAMYADGEYIVFHDADDLSTPNRLEKQVQFLEDNPGVGVVGTAYFYVNPLAEERIVKSRPTDDDAIRGAMSRECMINLGTAMFRRDALFETRLFQSDNVEGYELIIEIARDHDLANLGDPHYVYRINEGSRSQRHEIRKKAIMIKRSYQAARALDLGYSDVFLSLGWFPYLFLPPEVKSIVRRLFSPTVDSALSQDQQKTLKEVMEST